MSSFEEMFDEQMHDARKHFAVFRKHILEAQKQNLLAVKSLIDGATEFLDKQIERAVSRIETGEETPKSGKA
jgi:hypothetical protein